MFCRHAVLSSDRPADDRPSRVFGFVEAALHGLNVNPRCVATGAGGGGETGDDARHVELAGADGIDSADANGARSRARSKDAALISGAGALRPQMVRAPAPGPGVLPWSPALGRCGLCFRSDNGAALLLRQSPVLWRCVRWTPAAKTTTLRPLGAAPAVAPWHWRC